MKNDDQGFWYPVIDEEKCVDCGCCKNVCPLNNREVTAKEFDLKLNLPK
jgi:ferredoxin